MEIPRKPRKSTMKQLLLIVDPQIDFISGSLAVEGADKFMDRLAEYVKEHGKDYRHIVVTADWHPHNHCSFKNNGGPWPNHCEPYTVGASIYPPLAEAVLEAGAEILTKGTLPEREEYSVFGNDKSAARLAEIIGTEGEVDICGLCADICVFNTFMDACRIYGQDRINVLEEFTPYLANPDTLSDKLREMGKKK